MQNSNSILSRRQMMAIVAVAGGISVSSPLSAQFGKIGKVADAAKKIGAAESISDEELNSYFDQMAADMDRQNPVAKPSDPYGKRVAELSKGLNSYDGLNLDIKAYLVRDVNAFAMGNGTIRVFAGLMDQFTDDEVRYVIGHEIGHVKEGHSKERMQTALRTDALKSAASAAGGTAGRLANSELGKLFTKVITAQHSQGNEKEADDYAMNFMKKNNYNTEACVTALDKLAAMEGGSANTDWLATHPSPSSRAKRMRKQI